MPRTPSFWVCILKLDVRRIISGNTYRYRPLVSDLLSLLKLESEQKQTSYMSCADV